MIGQHFLIFDIVQNLKNVISGDPQPPKHQNEVLKDKSIYESSLNAPSIFSIGGIWIIAIVKKIRSRIAECLPVST